MQFRHAAALLMVLMASQAALAQLPTARRDSLQAALQTHPQADDQRVETLIELVGEQNEIDPQQSPPYLREGLAVARKLKSRPAEADLYYAEGVMHAVQGQLRKAETSFARSLALSEQLGKIEKTGDALNALANVLLQQGQYVTATNYYLRSLRLAETSHDQLGQAHALLNLGNVYQRMLNQPKAIAYTQQSLKLIGKDKEPRMYAGGLQNIAQSYLLLRDTTRGINYLQQSLALVQRSGDQQNEAALRSFLGQIAVNQHRLAAAEPQLRRSLELATAVGDQLTAIRSRTALGDLLRQQGNAAAAVQIYQQAVSSARQMGSYEMVMQLHRGLAVAYGSLGDFKAAYQNQQLFTQYKDSLLAETTTQQVTELQTKYETEKKDAQNRLQAARLHTQQQVIRRRNVQLWAGLAVTALLASLAYLLYNRRRLRREVEFAQERQQLAQARAAAVLEAEEAERRRIGADLHDGVGQLLTAAKLNLAALGDDLAPQTTGQQAMLQNALDVVDESFREVRSISHNLMPNSLIKRGLASAVRDFISKISPDGRLKVQLEVVGLDQGGRLPPTVENVLFRVIQELVQNIVKHARATELTLQLLRSDDELTVMVEDNGVGFDPAALGPDAGIGLHNIESRMAYLGGRADFDTTPGRGTTVTLEVPL